MHVDINLKIALRLLASNHFENVEALVSFPLRFARSYAFAACYETLSISGFIRRRNR